MHRLPFWSVQRLRLVRSVAIVGGLALVMASCSRTDGESAATPAPVTPVAAATEAPTALPEPTAIAEPVQEAVVNVYWLRGEGLAVGGRAVASEGVAMAAMNALVAGPNELETSLGMVSSIPAGSEVLGLNIADGVATVDLSSEFEDTATGTTGEAFLLAQVVYTLTQFPSVETVTIRIEGEEREYILSHGWEPNGLERPGFADTVSPGILVESPYPGQTVSSPIVISGESRTFESTVVFEVTDAAGNQIGFGFTTASQPEVDQFGPYSYSIELEPGATGPATVTAFEESAEDGSRIKIYNVPVIIEAAS